ncbi:HAMP domain-containing histidine kinase [Tissierella pigra]|uniref:histidine kinase n=1 Tax=Tissierella pigra TaxID=2607614 RepID=A0A6N7Y5E4_9FIRM|nr:HAMP domain-containing sensor histidine kinase [Tissierella pigra]MBU5426868.1 HAMP domain-containing histidine kinase [Tissierella pigra]MSU03260.1 HAMP domain-containing histidine kinase [Tissierella pigra]
MAIKLKVNKTRKNDYSVFKRKLFFKVFIFILVSIGFLILLSAIFRGKFGNWIVGFLQKTFNLSYYDALTIHQYTFRNNMDIIMLVLMVIFSLIIFRFAISRITRYFDEIAEGMDDLMKGSDKEIELSPEMSFLETKLNMCRHILEKRERDAKQAEQRKNDLVVYLAHDIKTPLTSVIGYLDLMSEIPDMPTEQRAKYMEITLEKANRLEKLINEFFEITRYNLQTIVLDKKDFNLSYMLFQMADEFYPMLSEKKQEVIVNAEDDIMLCGDSDKLARVFNNVFKNAIAYGDKNSKIIIDIYKQSQNAVVTFKNYGKSIPPQKLDSIFEKFYRLDESRGTDTGNSGLGLAIAKEIVVLHEGEIYAESNDNYTIFHIKIPGVINN